ncbi:unnamed protein product [Effrenium voratum]|nr:unnamed protein product [Effrenium voratum]
MKLTRCQPFSGKLIGRQESTQKVLRQPDHYAVRRESFCQVRATRPGLEDLAKALTAICMVTILHDQDLCEQGISGEMWCRTPRCHGFSCNNRIGKQNAPNLGGSRPAIPLVFVAF